MLIIWFGRIGDFLFSLFGFCAIYMLVLDLGFRFGVDLVYVVWFTGILVGLVFMVVGGVRCFLILDFGVWLLGLR